LKQTFFITGTDTGVGKTVLTTLLMKFLREQNVNTAALKPICSGNRDDARKIFAAMNGVLSLDEINPWHFRGPIAPLLAARRENKKVKLPEVVAHICKMQKRFDVLLVEGAGGLLSPLGENFNSRDLILALRANPIVVAQNKLGAINQILLTLEALPKNFRVKAKIVLVSPSQPDSATRSNAKLLAQFVPEKIIFTLPHFGEKLEKAEILKTVRIGRTLSALVSGF
jgi:dethiobiotin synthetase